MTDGRAGKASCMGTLLLQLAAVLALAAVQILARRLRHANRFGLSAAAGVSVAFVFLHLLPQLEGASEDVEETLGHLVPLTDHPVFALALVGLIAFYGLERLGRVSQSRQDGGAAEGRVALVGIGAFALYYALIRYLLGVEEDAVQLALFGVAMGVHFLAVDYGLRVHHRDTYDHVGRWVLAVAVVVGWLVAVLATLPGAAVAVMLSLLAGAVVLSR